MLFDRQRVLLCLADALGGVIASRDFETLLFLFTREREQKPSYEFVPYEFGPFSFTSCADKRKLIERGLLEDDPERWTVTESGRMAARGESALADRIRRFVEDRGKLCGDELIAEVYRRYPYFATRSRIVERVVSDPAERAAIAAARPQARGPGLVTLGYEGRSLESYLNALLQDSVTLLCDVRRNPLSRKFGFAKSTLRNACENVGIRYEHLPELGIASEDRRELKTQADYAALFADYERHCLPGEGATLAHIHDWIQVDRRRVALTCYEADPCQCHRHCVANALTRLGGPALIAIHL